MTWRGAEPVFWIFKIHENLGNSIKENILILEQNSNKKSILEHHFSSFQTKLFNLSNSKSYVVEHYILFTKTIPWFSWILWTSRLFSYLTNWSGHIGVCWGGRIRAVSSSSAFSLAFRSDSRISARPMKRVANWSNPENELLVSNLDF